MQLPLYRRLTQEDLADAPKGSWKDRLLYSLNLYMQQVYSGLNNNLTPEQNCISQTKTFQLFGGATPADNIFSFAASYPYQPLGRDVIDIHPIDNSTQIFAAAPYVSWSFGNGTFNVLGISGLTTGVQYQITIRIWWGQVINR
jgi:hypothetical protein